MIDGVPFVEQHDNLCGPAVLASVLKYYGEDVDQKMIAQEIYSQKLKGTLITDLENYAKKRGFKTELGRGTQDHIKKFLGENKPVIVLVDVGFWIISKLHYILVYGYDTEGFIAHDGLKKGKHFPYEVFEKIWEKTGYVYLVVSR